MLFWIVMPCRLLGRPQRFGEICPNLQHWKWRQYICPKHWCLHGVRAQKIIVILTGVRTLNLTLIIIFKL